MDIYVFLTLYNSSEYKPPSFNSLSETENTKQTTVFFLSVKKKKIPNTTTTYIITHGLLKI